jgi:predicted  nucleic acid-binding Zn-ribbon protein
LIRQGEEVLDRLITEVERDHETVERKLSRLAGKADKLAQLEVHLADRIRALTRELDEAETEPERAELRGFLKGLEEGLRAVREIGHVL